MHGYLFNRMREIDNHGQEDTEKKYQPTSFYDILKWTLLMINKYYN